MDPKVRFESPQIQLLAGIFLAAIGVFMLLNNFDVLDVGPAWKFWPLIIIAFGVSRIFQAQTRYQRGKGYWLLFLGAWMFITVFHVFGLGWHNSWPILIIGWGAAMVYKSTVQNASISAESEVRHGS